MRTIGLLGGMSWESTQEYYRMINQAVSQRLGALHSAKLLLYSVDFAEIEALQHAGDWERAGALLAEAAQRLERGGAENIVLCTNTMHKVAPAIQQAVGIPLLHITAPTAAAIQQAGLRRIGLLGTRFTMEQDFYAGTLRDRYGLDVLTPGPDARATVHRIIYDELCLGQIRAESRAAYQAVIAELIEQGAQGIILGCTEIELLIKPADCPVPAFDTTLLHAQAAVEWALAD